MRRQGWRQIAGWYGAELPRRSRRTAVAWLAGAVAACALNVAHAQGPGGAPECVHDPAVTERFLPLELITGLPLPADEALRFAPVDRVYPFTAYYPSGEPPRPGETSLKGPVEARTRDGRTVPAYERTVPGAGERMALNRAGDALGRIFDERVGDIEDEAKYPVGRWRQGETRRYRTVYHGARGAGTSETSITIEKLSCTYEGVPGAVQLRWRVDGGRRADYGYVFVPERGLVQVVVYKRAGG